MHWAYTRKLPGGDFLFFLVALSGFLFGANVQAAPATMVDAKFVQVRGRSVAQAHGWLATWPGVSWTLRFRGKHVGVKLTDNKNHYVLTIDGQAAMQIAPAPGERTVWLRDLAAGEHRAELIKRTESPREPGVFGGFVLDQGTALPSPPAEKRRIEFIGDSFTAGLGNLSMRRECTEAQFLENTDASRSFGVLTARALQADWQLNAMSGMGLLRNWNGAEPEHDYRQYYGRLLQTDTALTASPAWRPQLIVVGLGNNDFSTPVRADEPRTAAQLNAEFVSVYHALLSQLRQRYGNPAIIATAMQLYPDDLLRPLVKKIVATEQQAGQRVHYLEWTNLDLQGCVWHPSLADHQKMAAQLQAKIADIADLWAN